MVADQVAAPDDAATITQLLDTDHARVIQALQHLVGPAAGTLQAPAERGLTHPAPAVAVGICRQNSENGDFIGADILMLAPGGMHDPIAAPSSLMAHGTLHDYDVGSRRQREPGTKKPSGFRLSGLWCRPRMRVLSSLFQAGGSPPPRLQGPPCKAALRRFCQVRLHHGHLPLGFFQLVGETTSHVPSAASRHGKRPCTAWGRLVRLVGAERVIVVSPTDRHGAAW
jgi:hypothetical protein